MESNALNASEIFICICEKANEIGSGYSNSFFESLRTRILSVEERIYRDVILQRLDKNSIALNLNWKY